MTPTPPLSTAVADLDLQPINAKSERDAFIEWSQVFNRNARSYTARDFDHGLVAWLARAALARSAAPAPAADAVATLRKYWVDGSWNEASTESDRNEIADAHRRRQARRTGGCIVSRDELIAFLRENLSIEIETTSEYNGGMGDGPMYIDTHTVKLVLDNEVISEASI